MRWDEGLVRKMIQVMRDTPPGVSPQFEIEGYDDTAIGNHAAMMVERGLAKGFKVGTSEYRVTMYKLTSLTQAGWAYPLA